MQPGIDEGLLLAGLPWNPAYLLKSYPMENDCGWVYRKIVSRMKIFFILEFKKYFMEK